MENKKRCTIRIEGRLDDQWEEWFDGFKMSCQAGVTTLSGWVEDQSELHGVLTKINDLGLKLLSVTIENNTTD